MQQQRRTKIIATLGPSMDDPTVIAQMIKSGMNVVRANFSHGDIAEHHRRIAMVRQQAKSLNATVGILADLQGPKIRIAGFKNGKVHLKAGNNFTLDASLGPHDGDDSQVGVGYPDLHKALNGKGILLLDDGRIVLQVKAIQDSKIICRVLEGGELSDNKGINLRGGGLNAGAITAKDREDIVRAVELEVNYIALSFIRNADDIHEARHIMGKKGRYIGVIAKIERTEALKSIDEIIAVSDGVMVARGDLSIEIGDAEVPGAQKYIISRANHANKPVITATQMMESMILSKIPTRAEVSDVANAVLDGTDAVMLSAETAVGQYPDLVIEAVSRVCLAAEKQPSMWTSQHRMHGHFERVDVAIAMAAMYVANHLTIQAIVALTESGETPLYMSRIDSGIPIYAFSRHVMARGRMALYRGVYPIAFDVTQVKRELVNQSALTELQKQTHLNPGSLIILTKGDVLGVHGGSNALKILRIPEEEK